MNRKKNQISICFTYMNIDNIFDILVAFLFSMSPQLGGLGSKSQELLIYFLLGEGEPITEFYLRYFQTRSETYLLNDKKLQTNNLIKSAIVAVKGTSLDYGQRQRNERFSVNRLLLLNPMSQRRDGSMFMLHVDRVVSRYSVYCV